MYNNYNFEFKYNYTFILESKKKGVLKNVRNVKKWDFKIRINLYAIMCKNKMRNNIKVIVHLKIYLVIFDNNKTLIK